MSRPRVLTDEQRAERRRESRRESDRRYRQSEKGKKAWEKYYAANREKFLERARKQKPNPEKARERSRRWKEKNGELLRKKAREEYAANPEKGRQKNKNRYWGNPEKARKRVRDYYTANCDNLRAGNREHSKKYYAENRDTISAERRADRAANPEKWKRRYVRQRHPELREDQVSRVAQLMVLRQGIKNIEKAVLGGKLCPTQSIHS